MTKMNITYSSEMMTNHLQAELMSPQKKFEALQSNDGHALLFSISTDGILYLTREETGKSTTGWSAIDLSTTQIQDDFTEELSGNQDVTCRTFDAGQSAQDGTIGLAMVVSTNKGDQLYLCLNNSNEDISWADSPNWVYYPYDDPDNNLSKLEIVNVFFCETYDKTQYIIVDIVQDPSSAIKKISRYYIDPSQPSNQHWNEHFLPGDIEAEAGTFKSCIGRANNGYVDGVYTAGHIGSKGQLMFCPVINVFGSAPPTVVTLNLPEGAIASAIASSRNPDLSTDLFAVNDNTLYYFSSAEQTAKATGKKLISNNVLCGTSELYAMTHDGIITLWGLNSSDQVYYITCLQSKASDPSAWSFPVPILSEIEAISPYVNKIDGGNTIFASGGGQLQRITQTPTKMWQPSAIQLPATTGKPLSFNSYTTTIQVTDEQDLPLDKASLNLSASNRCGVYINGIYYVLTSTPIHINTNTLGTITIVEATETLNGTTFVISTKDGASVTINPMEEPFKKLTALGDNQGNSDKLSNAKFKEGDGTTQNPFVEKNLVSVTTENDLKNAAKGLASIDNLYDSINSSAPNAISNFTSNASLIPPMNIVDDIAIAAGDLFQWLESGVEAVVEVTQGIVETSWHFIAKIADKVYRAVLDTVDAVVGAVVWIFDAIKTTIEDIVKFVRFLFEWGDIKRTKEVLTNLINLYVKEQLDNIPSFKSQLDEAIESIESTIAKWSDIEWKNMGDTVSKPAASSAKNPMKGQTSASQHFSHHYQNQKSQISISNLPSTISPDLVQSLINDLLAALEQEEEVFNQIIENLKTLSEDFTQLSIEEVMKKLIGILAEGALGSTKVLIDVFLDILFDTGTYVLDLLNTKIHIPVISDILNKIGIPDISFIDLFCWIGAMAYTVVHKIATGKAPFPDNDDFKLLTRATSLSQLKRSLNTPQIQMNRLNAMSESTPTVSLNSSFEHIVFIVGHSVAATITWLAIPFNASEAAIVLENKLTNIISTVSAITAIISGALIGAANFLCPMAPIQNKSIKIINSVTTVIRISCLIFFSNSVQKKLNITIKNNRLIAANVDAILIIPAAVCTTYHFFELSDRKSDTQKTVATLEEISNVTSYGSRILYATAVDMVSVKNPNAINAINFMSACNLAYAGLHYAEVGTC